MDNTKRRIVISFDEGCSGNFLASIITNSVINTFNRIDIHDSHNRFDYGCWPTAEYPVTKKLLQHSVIVTHVNNIDQIKEIFQTSTVIRIVPKTGLFTAIYNVFSKKHFKKEIVDSWNSNFKGLSYDWCFEHLKDYYIKFTLMNNFKNSIIFNFGDLYNKDKLIAFFTENNISIINYDYIDRYLTQQMPLVLDIPASKNIKDIFSLIPSDFFNISPWFACYCIFCFELNNNFKESDRQWSIAEQAFINEKTLLDLSTRYSTNDRK